MSKIKLHLLWKEAPLTVKMKLCPQEYQFTIVNSTMWVMFKMPKTAMYLVLDTP